MQADEPIERVRAAFGAEQFERLQALKDRYDPQQRAATQPERPALSKEKGRSAFANRPASTLRGQAEA